MARTNEIGYGREFASRNLFVCEPENFNASNALEPSVHAPVAGRILMTRAIDLNRKFVLW